MDSWLARDSVENGLDSSEYDTSDSSAVGALIFPWLLYSDSCSDWFFLVLVACCVRALCSSPYLIVGLRSSSHSECVPTCLSQL